MNGILYYPYINVPRSDWTLRMLYYYDTVASIVPQEFIWEPEIHYEPFMLELVKEGLVVPIDPIQELSEPWSIGEPFLEFVQSSEFNLERSRRNLIGNKKSRIHQDKFIGKRIHADKFADNIFYSLSQLGLARKSDDKWYDVEPITAKYLMGYLASILSEKLERRATTDLIPRMRLQFNRHQNFNTRRDIILEKLMPLPREVNFGKLLDFKIKHENLLYAFRNRVEGLVLDTSIEHDSQIFQNKLDELEMQKQDIVDRMQALNIKDIILGPVMGITAAVVGVVGSGSLWGAVGAAPGLINAIHAALQTEKPENIIDQTGLKYLALMDKRL